MALSSLEENEAPSPDGNLKIKRIRSRLCSTKSVPPLASFEGICSQVTSFEDYPRASTVSSNIPVYQLEQQLLSDPVIIDALQDEWHHALLSGPGVVVLKNFVPDHALIEQVNSVFDAIIESEASQDGGKGDHFATSGKNSRIWNSFQKHALRDPESFVRYYSNPWLALISEAWLGPGYRVTAQVNIVRPGGEPQVAHRDYHLGFQTAEACARYPRTTQIATQLLTLQGGVAHSQMPLDSGPTRFLPFSQTFEEGYVAYRLPEFKEYFEKHWVSLPLGMGDAVFFNPALFHAAGDNQTSDINRSANLLQISSPFGKTMESLDSTAIVEECWNVMREKYLREGQSREIRALVTAIADSYPFPTNLDNRPPAPGGMAPESEVDVVMRGLEEDWATAGILRKLNRLRDDSLSL